MTLYVYDADSMEVVAKIEGDSNAECEARAAAEYGDDDAYGWTYTPAFGAVGGLVETSEAV